MHQHTKILIALLILLSLIELGLFVFFSIPHGEEMTALEAVPEKAAVTLAEEEATLASDEVETDAGEQDAAVHAPLNLSAATFVSSAIIPDRKISGYGYQFRQWMTLPGHDSPEDLSQQRRHEPYDNAIEFRGPDLAYIKSRMATGTISYQYGSLRVTDIPYAQTKEDRDWWEQTFAPYKETLDAGSYQTDVGQRYIDTGHWAFKASPDPAVSVYRSNTAVFVINGEETEPYYHASDLALLPDGSWAFRYQEIDPETCDASRNDACPGDWYINTSSGLYGPYPFRPTEPIPTSSGDFYYYTGEAVSHQPEDKTYALYKNGELVSEWDYIDQMAYSRDAEQIIFRARRGEEWIVVKNGTEESAPWDYVDHLLVSRFTDTHAYLARDLEGNWFMVKNEEARPLQEEPSRVYLNERADEPFAFYEFEEERPLPHSGYFVITKIISVFGEWHYPEPVRLEAVDSAGNMLFMSRKELPVSVLKNGELVTVQDFSNWNEDKAYWINDQHIGTGLLRNYFIYDDTIEKTYNSQVPGDATNIIPEGVLQGGYFDDQDRLIFYLAVGGNLVREVYALDRSQILDLRDVSKR